MKLVPLHPPKKREDVWVREVDGFIEIDDINIADPPKPFTSYAALERWANEQGLYVRFHPRKVNGPQNKE